MNKSTTSPKGVLFLAWINIALGALQVLASVASRPETRPLFFIAGFVSLAVGLGLRAFRRWALNTAIVLYMLGIVGGLSRGNILGGVVAALWMLYLCTPSVRQAFDEATVRSSRSEAKRVKLADNLETQASSSAGISRPLGA